MQELISKLTEKVGLSTEQATNTLGVVKDFITEKFPMLGSAVESMMGGAKTDAATGVATEATNAATAETGSMLDKISDVIPGAMGEKVEDFAKGLGDKLGGFFGK